MSHYKFLILAASAALAAGCQQSDQANQTAAGNSTGTDASAGGTPSSTIAQGLAGSNEHSKVAQAIKAAGLEATMAGSQPYTLFAPTNAAFDKLPEGASDQLMKSESKGQLTALITHHLVPGVVTAEDLAKAIENGGGKTELRTMGGDTLTIAKEGETLILTDTKGGRARMTGADMLQSNGVIHSVDTILLPA